MRWAVIKKFAHNQKLLYNINILRKGVSKMTEIVIDTSSLPESVAKFISTEQAQILPMGGKSGVTIVPLEEVEFFTPRKKPKLDENGEEIDYIAKLKGSFAKYPQMSVDRFLERNRAEKELEF